MRETNFKVHSFVLGEFTPKANHRKQRYKGDKKAMTKPYERNISELKELFLVLCLMSKEVSMETMRMIKSDYGEQHVARCIINKLIQEGIIQKIKHTKGYSYILTDNGYEYIKRKFPKKYNYGIYQKTDRDSYDEATRVRNQKLSTLLYYLYRQGVSLENHFNNAVALFNGKSIFVNEPFFVSLKELRHIDGNFKSIFGCSVYGCVISKASITVVYAPDGKRQLRFSNEMAFKELLIKLLENAKSPYNDSRNYNVLYLYTSVADIKSSFTVQGNKSDKKVSQTRVCYQKLNYCNAYIVNATTPVWKLNEVGKAGSKILEVFVECFNLQPYNKTLKTMFADGIYQEGDKKALASVIWNLNPQKILDAMTYVYKRRSNQSDKHQKSDLVMLCYEEQIPTLQAILQNNKQVSNKIVVVGIKRNDVLKYLNGEIENISWVIGGS